MNAWHTRKDVLWRLTIIRHRGRSRSRLFQTQKKALACAEKLEKYPGGLKAIMLERVELRVLFTKVKESKP